MTDLKTKKLRRRTTNKKKLWQQFDNEIGAGPNSECVYTSKGPREKCDCCSSMLLLTEEGFPACSNKLCGVIYTDTIDQSAEWRYYGADDSSSSDPTRCGMPINPLLQESSYGCKVLVNGKSSYEMRKIRRYTDWLGMPYKEKSQYDEFQKITILGTQSGISKLIIDDAMRYHKKISEAKTFRGLNRDGIIAASIYVSARINRFPRTAREIATIFNLDSAAATRGCKNAISIINELESEFENTDKTSLCQTTPLSFIDRYCSKLNMNQELTKVCKFVATRIQRNNLIPENTPHSIAAGIVYFVSQVCNINIGKKAVSQISEISEVTINKCYKKLADMSDELIPDVILKKYS
jgi:transcription initiation factor TFIIB